MDLRNWIEMDSHTRSRKHFVCNSSAGFEEYFISTSQADISKQIHSHTFEKKLSLFERSPLQKLHFCLSDSGFKDASFESENLII